MTSLPDNNPINTMEKLHLFDNRMGYRYGQFLWYAFWLPSLLVLLCDDTTGHGRDFLAQATMMSSLTLLYYFYHQNIGSPASTPAIHALYGELLTRWILASYHGINNITSGTNAIAVMNMVHLCSMLLLTLFKLPTSIYTTCNNKTYKDFVKNIEDDIY
jgi:hypothetical protein